MKQAFFRSLVLLIALAPLQACAPAESGPDLARLDARAERVEIIRDDWGVPHIYAPTDADVVFGLMYTQAEDDFNRIETNFLTSLGRMAEAHGEERLWQDLRMKLFIDPVELQAMYAESPEWLRDLMDAWADGLNYYLATHPEVEPMVLDHFEPWMALSFSEGSIGGDIERVRLERLEAFYGDPEASRQALRRAPRGGEGASPARLAMASPAGATSADPAMASPAARAPWADGLAHPDPDLEPSGSNGIAIAPENTVDGKSLFLINPHTSFFFRHEAHLVSEEGLNAYGALTWGQFFVYQGFNETAGWMHTSSSVDNIDEFAETIVETDDGLFYRYGDELRPVETKETTVRYRAEDGSMAERTFTTYRTHHGPIVRSAEDGRWIATALMEEPMRALIQSYSRTKAANLDAYLEVMETHTNSSNNTVFADAEGNVAYLHSNFIPVRDTRFDYSAPVDGSDPATDWNGVHSLEESPNSINPATGFAFCSNNWPYSAAGAASPDRDDFPAYMDRGRENPRGVHMLRLLPGRTDFTLDGLVETAYSTQMPWFDEALPRLFADYAAMPAGAEKTALAPAIAHLRGWDRRWGVESIPTSIGVYWATRMRRGSAPVEALADAVEALEADFGSIETPWGEINRFQRVNGEIVQPFNDTLPSTPVGFASSLWGTLASFGARQYPDTKRWYGTSGNSFVAVVEFGGPGALRARAVTAGGLNHDPDSPHFNDQAERYATGNLRDVRFYRADVEANAERTYRPGGR
ncbi:MAG: penicillin acylase family protein [Longimicrobiales bacterium]|nr:penicillin acylase family protein [Longimicrobiales bacterium]